MGGFPYERLCSSGFAWGAATRRPVPCFRSRQPARRVVKDHAQREAFTAFDPAHAMAQIDAISPARPFHGPLAHREDDAVALRERRDLRARLHARPLLGQYELAAGEVALGLREQDRDLQRKKMLAVHV